MTRASKLPALPPVQTNDVQLQRWMQAVAERLEVREGSRGDPDERVVTIREMKVLGLDASQFGVSRSGFSSKLNGGVMVQGDDGSFSRVPMSAFADELRKTKLYQDLMRSIDDMNRFDDVPAQVRAILLSSLADEAAARGADIRRLEVKQQSDLESLAYTVEQVTASVAGVSAGVREVTYASATANEATAGKVTQITAQLGDATSIPEGDFYATTFATLNALTTSVAAGTKVKGKYYKVLPASNATTGTPNTLYIWNGTAYVVGGSGTTATVEQKMAATASRSTGLEAQYTLKVKAGNKAVAGFGIAATENTDGNATSAFIVQADKFAVVSSSYNGDAVNPDLSAIPFGVDAYGVYINGQVRIKTEGQTTPAEAIEDALKTAKLLTLSSTGIAFIFKDELATTSDSPAITITATRTNIPTTAPITFTAEAFSVSGSRGLIALQPSNDTVTISAALFRSKDHPDFQPTLHVKVKAIASYNGTSVEDTLTIYRGNGGTNAITAILSNEAHTIPADNAGDTGETSFTGATTFIKIYQGIDDVTRLWKFGAVGAGVTGDFGGIVGDTYVANALNSGLTIESQSKPTVRVTGMSADVGTVSIFATRSGYPPQTKVFSLSKSKAGIPGLAGNAGSVTLYGSGSWATGNEWDALANALVLQKVKRAPSIGDTVTLKNTNVSADPVLTKYWSGVAFDSNAPSTTGWVLPGVVINGNLLVGGTVTADKIGVGAITAASIDTSGYGIFAGGAPAVLDKLSGVNMDLAVYARAPETTSPHLNAPYRVGVGGACFVKPSGAQRNPSVPQSVSTVNVGVLGFAESPDGQIADARGVIGYGSGNRAVGGHFMCSASPGAHALTTEGPSSFGGPVGITGGLSVTAGLSVTDGEVVITRKLTVNGGLVINGGLTGATLPKGDKGDKGDTGATGATGAPGNVTYVGNVAGNPGTAFAGYLTLSSGEQTVRIPYYNP